MTGGYRVCVIFSILHSISLTSLCYSENVEAPARCVVSLPFPQGGYCIFRTESLVLVGSSPRSSVPQVSGI